MFGGLFGDFGIPASTSNTEPHNGGYKSLHIQVPANNLNTEDVEMEEMSSLELSASQNEPQTSITGSSDPQMDVDVSLQTQQPTNNTEEDMEISGVNEEYRESPLTEIFRLNSLRTEERKNQTSLSRHDAESHISITGSTGGAGTPLECPFNEGSTVRPPVSKGGFTLCPPEAASTGTGEVDTDTPGGCLSNGGTTAKTPAPLVVSRGNRDNSMTTMSPESHIASSCIQQLQNDEAVARVLQEEMDREYALSLQSSIDAGHNVALDHPSTMCGPPRAEPVPAAQYQQSRCNPQRVPQLPAAATRIGRHINVFPADLSTASGGDRGREGRRSSSSSNEQDSEEEIYRTFVMSLRDSMGAGHSDARRSSSRVEQMPPVQNRQSPRAHRRNAQRVPPLPSVETCIRRRIREILAEELSRSTIRARGGDREWDGRRRSASSNEHDYEVFPADLSRASGGNRGRDGRRSSSSDEQDNEEEIYRTFVTSLRYSMGAGHSDARRPSPRVEQMPTVQHRQSPRTHRRNAQRVPPLPTVATPIGRRINDLPANLSRTSGGDRGRDSRRSSSSSDEQDNEAVLAGLSRAIGGDNGRDGRRRSSSPDRQYYEGLAADLTWQHSARARVRGGGQNVRRRSSSSDGEDYEALLALGERLGYFRRLGLSSQEIDQLPIVSCTDGDAAEECNICMEAYDEGHQTRYLPCLHRFHVECIDRWLRENASCPICRMDILMELLPNESD